MLAWAALGLLLKIAPTYDVLISHAASLRDRETPPLNGFVHFDSGVTAAMVACRRRKPLLERLSAPAQRATIAAIVTGKIRNGRAAATQR